MNRHRILVWIAAATMAGAVPAQQPPQPPAPPARAASPAIPPALAAHESDDFELWEDEVREIKAELARERALMLAERMKESVMTQVEAEADAAVDLSGETAKLFAMEAVLAGLQGKGFAMAQIPPKPPTPPTPPTPAKFRGKRHESDDRAYERGQRALDNRRWDEALEAFTHVASSGGSRAEGALYWKAYTLNKLGRRDDALATIAELRKTYASSRWLDDAKALEAEVRQASGKPVRPEDETDEDIKLMALNALVQSDPDRAIPLLENLLKTSQAPKLKERAIFVLAQSNSPRGRQLLEQVARGGAGNPDLQLKAIRYIAAMSRKTDNRALLWDIYSGSNQEDVKRAALSGMIAARDKDHLLQVARTEKSPRLRMEAISMLGATGAQSELWQIYQQEQSAEVKQQILHSMIAAGSSDRLTEVAKTEKDPKLRRSAVRALGAMGSARTGDTLLALYGSESDPEVKNAVIDGLMAQNNAKALVDLARKETNASLKRDIVRRLSHMKSKEATDYMLELLK